MDAFQIFFLAFASILFLIYGISLVREDIWPLIKKEKAKRQIIRRRRNRKKMASFFIFIWSPFVALCLIYLFLCIDIFMNNSLPWWPFFVLQGYMIFAGIILVLKELGGKKFPDKITFDDIFIIAVVTLIFVGVFISEFSIK